MAMKQPRVPEYRESEGAGKYLKSLVLFLKDFCMDVWTASNGLSKGLSGISYPVTSVNGQTGEVKLSAQDVGARASSWMPTASEAGALPKDGTAANSTKFNGKTWAQALLAIYPVGAIYLSASSTSPASLFGGTWEQLKDCFLLGAGNSYAAGSTGGESAHVITENEMPSHVHRETLIATTVNGEAGSESATGYNANIIWKTSMVVMKASHDVASAGGNAAHNNMPPYLAVYMWKRVS